MTQETAPSTPPPIRKKAEQRASYVPMENNPNKCPVCKSFLKKQQPGLPKICIPCYYRNMAKEAAELKASNPDAPIKTKLLIGKL